MHKDEVLETIRILLKFYGNDLRRSGEEQAHHPETYAAPAGSELPIREAANMTGEPEAAAEGVF